MLRHLPVQRKGFQGSLLQVQAVAGYAAQCSRPSASGACSQVKSSGLLFTF